MPLRRSPRKHRGSEVLQSYGSTTAWRYQPGLSGAWAFRLEQLLKTQISITVIFRFVGNLVWVGSTAPSFSASCSSACRGNPANPACHCAPQNELEAKQSSSSSSASSSSSTPLDEHGDVTDLTQEEEQDDAQAKENDKQEKKRRCCSVKWCRSDSHDIRKCPVKDKPPQVPPSAAHSCILMFSHNLPGMLVH